VGNHAEHLRQLAVELSIHGVEFGEPAFGDAKWREYSRASLSVLPSRSENFGMTVAESLAAGTPVIASQNTPWDGLVLNGCGWWPRLDEAEFANALESAMLLGDVERAEMGRRGAKWMVQSFSWDAIARQMTSVLEWVRGGGTPPECVRIK
jgi:glycosyltransferase involved in cell wall biosynthesis